MKIKISYCRRFNKYSIESILSSKSNIKSYKNKILIFGR